MLESTLWTAVAVAGLVGSAVCSGVEMGFYCLSRVRLEIRLSRPDRAARLVRTELNDPGRLLATVLLWNNLCNYAGTLGVTALLGLAGLSDGLTVLLQVLLLTPMLLVFGESLPKEVFRLNADTLPYRFVPLVRGARLLATATLVLPMLMLGARATARRLGQSSSPLALSGQRRLLHMLEESAHSGVISGVQGALAERALVFERSTVSGVMTPWIRVDRVDAETTRERATEVALRTGRSALPVVDARKRVVGVVQAIDLFRGEGAFSALWGEPVRLSPDEPLRRALGRLADTGAGLGVVEANGRAIGVVTRSDLVRPLLEGARG